jgi:hypothetical protein
VRKVSEVDITESDRALGGRLVACSGMAGMELIVGRLDVARTCDDAVSAAIPMVTAQMHNDCICTMNALST